IVEASKYSKLTCLSIYSDRAHGHYIGAYRMGSKVDQAGLRIGDRIFAINGISTTGLTNEEVDDLVIDGEAFAVLILPE
ncbi:hypothetical protein PFISCL1PPCAC_28565, partial [Pristionchus fissidentatus]